MRARLTIRQYLLLWMLSGTVIAFIVAGFSVYLKIQHETDELFDYQLKQIVRSFPSQMSRQNIATLDTHPGKKIVVQVWNKEGEQVFITNAARELPRYERRGFIDVTTHGERWRVYSEENSGQLVQTAQLVRDRETIQEKLLWRCLIPILSLLPVLAVLIWLGVGRSLQPLHRLTGSLRQRSADDLQRLDSQGYTQEIIPIVDALNDLFARLYQAMQLQKRFVADAAHELRTPLAALKLQLQLVEMADDDEERSAAIKKLHERLNRATHQVQQLLALARHGGENSASNRETVNLQRLAAGVVSDYAPLAESKKIDLGVEAAEQVLTVDGNIESMRIMLGNVVGNAIRYTPSSGKVDVRVLSLDGRPCLQVDDTGAGIPEEERERVFDRFYRREVAQESGSGLGLAIVKNVAAQHGARVSLHDGPQGKGLSVRLVF
ncbi:Sensory histidine kinase QseC [Collimonas arenae]|uniref:histidine kinase n=1 Tax=Collimonas arenae TaxID=279058 RepID=A0A0A1FEN3_9BURK|nr:ATP-binding protein [Collimonas arenae]AIY42134.1 Sensory histidine kinase QseC [Collimonas arenae]